MDIIKYEGTTVHVPTSWEDVTLAVYEANYKREATTLRDKVAVMAGVCNIEPAVFMGWAVEAFDAVVARLGFIFEEYNAEPSPIVEINGVKFSIPCEDSLTLAQWVDAEQAHKDGTDEISTILSIVCQPVGEAYDPKLSNDRIALFKSLTMDKIQPLISFFLLRRRQFELKTEVFSKLTASTDQLAQSIAHLRKRGAGISLSQTLRAIIYFPLMLRYRYQLRKLSRSYNTKRQKRAPRKRRETSTKD